MHRAGGPSAILYLDLETYSEVPIKHGTHRYAEGAEVLLSAFAVDDGEVEVVEGWPPRLTALALAADKIVIHNSKFDRTVLAAQGVSLFVHKIHDTMAQARSVGLPGALGMLCDVLGVPIDKAKDKEGRQFIQLFCKPLPKNRKERRATKETHPVEWARFLDYAKLDVEAMREVFKRLPTWNYQGAERELWQLDMAINDRGFAIDLDLARAAITAVAAEQKRLAARAVDLTGGDIDSTNQRDKLLAHLLGEYGVTLPDMQKGTLERRVNDEELPAAVRELLAIRLEASGTSTAKYQALVNATSSDGRLRGGLEWCGAARTGRWSGRLFQPQNLPRPRHKPDEIAASIEALKAGCADLIFDDVIARASSAIRGAIVAPPGRKLVAADLSNIEGRVLAWLAGEAWKLEAFREYDRGEGPDLYLVTAGAILRKPPEQVTPDERQSTGKVPELACGYQGAVGAFSSMAQLYGLDLPEEEVLRIVKLWRQRNASIVGFWYELERKALAAVRKPESTVACGRLKLRRDGSWLRIVLPSGRALCYPAPRIDGGIEAQPARACPDCKGDDEFCFLCDGTGRTEPERAVPPRLSYMGINQYSRKWERIDTYGGKLAENVTQAVARDVIADAMPRAEAAGYEVVLTVHDEIVTETPDEPRFSAEGLSRVMTTNPAWADGLPLAAAGFEGTRYGK
jgi:DNA polymerase